MIRKIHEDRGNLKTDQVKLLKTICVRVDERQSLTYHLHSSPYTLPLKLKTTEVQICLQKVVMQFECGTRILRVIHGRDARATSANCITTLQKIGLK
jgi:hypothetical protein